MTDSDRFAFLKLHWDRDALIHQIEPGHGRAPYRRYPAVPDRSRSAPGGAA